MPFAPISSGPVQSHQSIQPSTILHSTSHRNTTQSNNNLPATNPSRFRPGGGKTGGAVAGPTTLRDLQASPQHHVLTKHWDWSALTQDSTWIRTARQEPSFTRMSAGRPCWGAASVRQCQSPSTRSCRRTETSLCFSNGGCRCIVLTWRSLPRNHFLGHTSNITLRLHNAAGLYRDGNGV